MKKALLKVTRFDNADIIATSVTRKGNYIRCVRISDSKHDDPLYDDEHWIDSYIPGIGYKDHTSKVEFWADSHADYWLSNGYGTPKTSSHNVWYSVYEDPVTYEIYIYECDDPVNHVH